MADDEEEFDELEILNSMERRVYPDENEADLANRIFKENLPHAARMIVEVALKGGSERVRYDASKYIVERMMGRLSDATADPMDGPLSDLMDAVVKEMEEHDAG